MGLFDLDMSTPQGQGFNNALLAAAQALLTPRSRGGGMGAAFGAFPQAIDRAKANAMREQLMALQGRQVGLQTDKLGFDMEQAKAQQAEAMRNRENFARLVGTLPPEQRMIAEQLGPDYFKGMAPQPVKPTFQKWFENGQERSGFVAPGQAPQPVGDAKPQDMDKWLIRDESGNWVPNRALIEARSSVAKAGAASQSVNNFVMPSTPGQKKADEKFGVDFVDFATGGYADVVKQLDQLREASKSLKSGAQISGSFMGNLPDAVLAVTNPQAVATKESIQEVAQRNLRLILGVQFTEKEGERLIARVFNPRLDETENAKRVDRLIKQIGDAAKAKLDAAQYFQQHGSLTGWQGRLPRLSDFDPDAKDGGATGAFDGGTPKRLKFNPATGQLE